MVRKPCLTKMSSIVCHVMLCSVRIHHFWAMLASKYWWTTGLHNMKSQRIVSFMVIAVRTSNSVCTTAWQNRFRYGDNIKIIIDMECENLTWIQWQAPVSMVVIFQVRRTKENILPIAAYSGHVSSKIECAFIISDPSHPLLLWVCLDGNVCNLFIHINICHRLSITWTVRNISFSLVFNYYRHVKFFIFFSLELTAYIFREKERNYGETGVSSDTLG